MMEGKNPMQFNTWFGIKVADGTTLASGPTKQKQGTTLGEMYGIGN